MTDAVDPVPVALAVTAVLDALGIAHTIGGSLASSFAGEPRSTVDVDIVAAIEEEHVPALVARLTGEFYIDDASLLRAVRNRTNTNLVHNATNLKIALFIAGGTPLDLQQIARPRAVVVSGRTIYVHPPEDILLQKLRWYKSGGGVSDRQWRDIAGIIRTQGRALDRGYLREHAPTLGVADLLEQALAQND